MQQKKNCLVLGAGFIGGHLCKRLKEEGHLVAALDIKPHDYWEHSDICDMFLLGDLRDPTVVQRALAGCNGEPWDEVYQLAADMGGAGYIFTGENDANVMHNSALVNLNIAKEAVMSGVKRLFYSSSACMYPAYNQEDPANPNCSEDSAYPAAPDSEYGWEKLFSERMYKAFERNHNLQVRIARFHNIFGPQSCFDGGREKAPAAICRKVAEALDELPFTIVATEAVVNSTGCLRKEEVGDRIKGKLPFGMISIWGDGQQTRSFLYIDECIDGILRLMRCDDCFKVINIGSDEMISINDLAKMVIEISGKNLTINNIPGPTGVRGRNSDNKLIQKELGWSPSQPLRTGMEKLYKWVEEQVNNKNLDI